EPAVVSRATAILSSGPQRVPQLHEERAAQPSEVEVVAPEVGIGVPQEGDRLRVELVGEQELSEDRVALRDHRDAVGGGISIDALPLHDSAHEGAGVEMVEDPGL